MLYPSRKRHVDTHVYIDGLEISVNEVDLNSLVLLPFYKTYSNSVVVLACEYQNSLCIMYYSSYYTQINGLYIYDKSIRTWTFISSNTRITKSAYFLLSYNDELHLYWENQNDDLFDYVFNGTTWVQERTYSNIYLSDYYDLVYFNGKIYAVANPNVSTTMQLVRISTTDNTFEILCNCPVSGTARLVVYDNEVHILSGTKHYKWNDTSLETVSTIPLSLSDEIAVVNNNKIHIIKDFAHYSWDGSSWTQESDSLFLHDAHCQGVTINNVSYLLSNYGIIGIEPLGTITPKDVTAE